MAGTGFKNDFDRCVPSYEQSNPVFFQNTILFPSPSAAINRGAGTPFPFRCLLLGSLSSQALQPQPVMQPPKKPVLELLVVQPMQL